MVRPKWFLTIWYAWRKPCTYLAPMLTPSPMYQNKIPHDPHHLGVPSGASKTFSKPMVRSAQTVHLSCVKISTISKQIEMSFHLNLVSKEYHQVCSKWFLSVWHVSCKLCTYFASRLAVISNGPKWASTWASSPRSTIWCVQSDFRAYGSFGANRAPI
jgi:hypothetical protein